ncbi:universal stress protein [Burkholderia glumae]|uniref:Universal stress protein n=2 Tax=Burkholderia glumae TaxID=337 RepID=A0AAP9XXK1_BURGL|nr:universal stress protein [Burkholderia glumae]AJY63154.1 universal stress family protein [Burkholderia glumae LMG 2196 = ATCC 33617]KHJ61090.1 universal stress protein UspA [Burkholderia glumae]MCM2484464.1 universal stress protein [Burkholderia glumae]MCM2494833.1 universal stress protein [Burkholderia glumae]MCM2510156.1 universal stress protein [Burkholderia glumae]
MSYQTILVHLDSSARAHARLDIALRLASQFDAWVVALYAVYTPDPDTFTVMAGSAEYYIERAHERKERRDALKRLFHAELNRAHVEGAWIDATDSANRSVVNHAHYADLVIAGQDDPQDPETFVDSRFPETVVMSAGRPVLLIPFRGEFTTLGKRVLVAWDGGREATRAAHDALPFLERAQQTLLVTVNGPADEPAASLMPGADIACALARHGARVEARELACERPASIGDVLLSQASEVGADLLVMGAYGHARWRELVLGGTTRTVFASMTLPVLISH